jgi:hypothetical protein
MSFTDMRWKVARVESEGLYSAYLTENPDLGVCRESVYLGGALIHREEFPSSRLGDADRDVYVGAMLASAIRRNQMGTT